MDKTEFCPKDNLAGLVVDRLRWSPVRTAVYAFLWTWFNAVVAALLNQRLFPGPGYRALTVDYFHHFSTFLYAIAWGYFIWLFKAPAEVIEELHHSNVVVMDDQLSQKAKRIIRESPDQIVAFLAAILACSLNFYQDLIVKPSWLNASVFVLVLRYVFLIIPTTYVVIVVILRFMTYARVFRLVLRNVKLHPLHPDKAGGLHPLGSYALKTTYPLAFAGSVAAAAVYWSYINSEMFLYFYFAAMAYIILAPLMFFVPLSSAHTAMLNAKNELKAKISLQFNNDYSLAYNEISGTTVQLKENLEKLEQLQKMHAMADSFPVWPFDVQTIRQFALTMLSPVFTVLLSILTNYVSKLLTP